MLRPQDNATRERKTWTGVGVRAGPERRGRSAGWFRARLRTPARWPVPASFNDIAADAAVRDYVGDVWYQTRSGCRAAGPGSAIVLHFESATHRATVWVDDTEVVSHEGGYTPFEADVTEHVRAGEEVRITVVVNNTLSFQSIPPGVIEDTPDGHGSGTSTTSSTTPACTGRCGCTPRRGPHIDDITVVTGLDGGGRHRRLRIDADGADEAGCASSCGTPTGAEVAHRHRRGGHPHASPNVHRWAPGDGYLYDLEVAAGRPATASSSTATTRASACAPSRSTASGS